MASKKIQLYTDRDKTIEASPETSANCVILSDGNDLQKVLDNDLTTPTVVHEETNFKVGVGDVNVSSSVVDGEVGRMVIKGKTYQNILPEPSLRNSMTNGKSMQKLNEGYENVSVVDGVAKSAILKGVTGYKDVDTGEILETFEEGRNLELVSVKMPVLKTTGKNLFDMNRPYDAITDSQATVVQDTNQITVSSADSGTYASANFILDKDFFAGKTVTGSCLYESDIKDIGTVQINYQDGNGKKYYHSLKYKESFTFPNDFTGDILLCVYANNTGTPQSNTVTVKNIQLELGTKSTTYDSHKSNVSKIPLLSPLRSLPNGVCVTS